MHNLANDKIHVWYTTLRISHARLAQCAATLHAPERERAARFRFKEHQHLFIAARGILRELLSSYLDQAPSALHFNYAQHGKPLLADNTLGIHFNLAHSADHALYAVARRPVGVDLEIMERDLDKMALAQRICSAREWAAFQALPREAQQAAFFTCWTRKEALLKATGQGLGGGLKALELCFHNAATADERIALTDTAGQVWSILNLPLPSAWVGALAASGADWQWQWQRF